MRHRASLLDNIATSSGTSVLIGVVALIATLILPQSSLISVVIWVAVAIGLLPIIRHYNITRNASPIACALYLLLQAAMTDVDSSTIENCALPVASVAGMALLFSTFQSKSSPRPVFTAMLMTSACMVWWWAFIPLTAVWIIGTIQMRAISPRSLSAMLLGLITAPLLIYGFGIATPALPELPIAPAVPDARSVHLYASVGYSILLTVVCGGACMLTSYGYQARPRACNALIYTLSIYAIAVCMADLGNASAYMGLLNLCAAYHVGHFAVSHSRGWVTVALTFVAAMALYVWNSWI